MSRKESSRRVNLAKDQHATATRAETERTTGGVQSHRTDDSRSTQAAQTRCGYTPEQVARGNRVLHRAETWRADNAQAWACIVSHALDLASEQQPIAAQSLIESVRKKAFVDRYGKDTKTNNDYAAIFARWLVLEYPETAPHVELRRSVFDLLIGGRGGR